MTRAKPHIEIVTGLMGIALLLFGRRLFWFFIAAAGFAAGVLLARDFFELHSELQVLAIGLLAGLLGALLSVLLQKLAIAIAGFTAGGYLAAAILQQFNADAFVWIGFVLGGALGAVLLLVLFDWALILLSSLLGAALLADSFGTDTAPLIFALASIVGLVLQAMQLRASPPVRKAPPGE